MFVAVVEFIIYSFGLCYNIVSWKCSCADMRSMVCTAIKNDEMYLVFLLGFRILNFFSDRYVESCSACAKRTVPFCIFAYFVMIFSRFITTRGAGLVTKEG